MLCIRPCQIGRHASASCSWKASRAGQSIRTQYLAIRVHMHSDHRKRTVLVYDGEGAGSRSVVSAVESLRNSLSPQVQVHQLGPEKLLSGTWQDGCLMLVMPGGADLPYCRQLNGHGNSLVRGFVEAGGAYLGLCAGAYYACSYVSFAPGTKLEVKGARELAFFLGVAAGPVYAGFRYESENGAHAARVAFRPPQPAASGNSATATNGHGAPQKTPSVTAASPQQDVPMHGVGLSGAAVLCSAQQGTPPVPVAAPEQGQSMPTAAARETAADGCNRQEGTSRAAASAAEPGAGWLTCRDYTNGGPHFVPDAVSGAGGSGTPGRGGTVECARPGFERLAVYPDKGNGLAAVRCSVGAGVAVLVGTHPELDPKWLAADSDRVSAVADELKPHAAGAQQGESEGSLSISKGSVRAQLEKSRAERELFWKMLLQAAGMGLYLADEPSRTMLL